jgi:hypothetical protein
VDPFSKDCPRWAVEFLQVTTGDLRQDVANLINFISKMAKFFP